MVLLAGHDEGPTRLGLRTLATPVGMVRKLPSGRYQARYRGPDGKLWTAPHTFERKSEASRWLSLKDTEITHGDWLAPELAKAT